MKGFGLQTYQTITEAETIRASQHGVLVQNLIKLYPKKGRAKSTNSTDYIAANDNISLEIQSGEIFGLLGPNGAGKTTLVNQLLGLTRPDSGTILVEGLTGQQFIASWQPGFRRFSRWKTNRYYLHLGVSGNLRGEGISGSATERVISGS